MSIPAWDKWAAAAYLFTIGLAIGFVAGFSLGVMEGSSDMIFVVLIPVIVIAIVFIALFMMARRIYKQG